LCDEKLIAYAREKRKGRLPVVLKFHTVKEPELAPQRRGGKRPTWEDLPLRKKETRFLAVIVILMILMAATSVFASKEKTENPQPSKQEVSDASAPTQAPSSDEPLNITLSLNDGNPLPSGENAAPEMAQSGMADGLDSALTKAAKDLSTLALKFLGRPYKWGGTTPAAFDCSGFTRYIYNKLGIKLPRTAREQYKTGQVVKSGNWKPGDLIFFDMMKGYVSHVGMYLGNMSFIHACSPKTGVRIDSLNKRRYKKCYVGARRYDS